MTSIWSIREKIRSGSIKIVFDHIFRFQIKINFNEPIFRSGPTRWITKIITAALSRVNPNWIFQNLSFAKIWKRWQVLQLSNQAGVPFNGQGNISVRLALACRFPWCDFHIWFECQLSRGAIKLALAPGLIGANSSGTLRFYKYIHGRIGNINVCCFVTIYREYRFISLHYYCERRGMII